MLKWEGVKTDVIDVRERPSSCKDGGGSDGGGVEERGGREGEEVLEELSRLGGAASTPSRVLGRIEEFEDCSRSLSGRRCIRFDIKLEKRLEGRFYSMIISW